MVEAVDQLVSAIEDATAALRDALDRDPARRRPWQEWEDDALRRLYPIAPAAPIAEALNRTTGAVYQRARTLGIEKDERFLNSPLSGRTGHDDRGRSGQFGSGHQPWNKGRKGWQAGGRSAETQFEPGHRPHNWKPIGHERVDSYGYLWRKVRDGSQPSTYNYEPVHVLVWEEHHGPVPDDHAVVFRNGNKADVRIENLELVSRADLMRRNTRHRYPEEINAAIQAKAVLTRRINKLERNHAA